MIEEMKEINGFPGYKINKNGEVFSYLKRKGLGTGLGSAWYISDTKKKLKESKRSNRYCLVVLRREGKSYTKYVHKLVMEAFAGKCPEGLECCHNDGNPSNNRFENLRYDTHQGNVRDRMKHGTHQCGIKNVNAKFNRFQIQRIRLMKEVTPKLSCKEISRIFNVNPLTIYKIINNTSYGNL